MKPSDWLTTIKEIIREQPLSKRYTDSRLIEHFGLAQERLYDSAVYGYYAGLQASTTLTTGNTTTGRGSVEGPEDLHSQIWTINSTDRTEMGRAEIDEVADEGITRDMSGLYWYANAFDVKTWTLVYNKIPPHPHQGTAQAAAATTITLATTATYGSVDTRNDYYNGALVEIISGTTGAGQVSRITDYNGSTKVATVNTWGVTPTGTVVYFIRPVFSSIIQATLCWDVAVRILIAEGNNRGWMLKQLVDADLERALHNIVNWNKRRKEPPHTPADNDR